MDLLDETLFDLVLGFLTPQAAACLGSVSTTFQRWVNESPRWKGWCEQACLSNLYPPAREVLEKRYGLEGGRSHKQLFVELKGSGLPVEDANQSDGERRWMGCSEFVVLLLDIYIKDDCIYSCSISGPGPSLSSDVCHTDPKMVHCMTNFGVSLDNVTERKLLDLIEPTRQDRSSYRGSFSYSLRFLRKSDGRIQTLLDKQAVPGVRWGRALEFSHYACFLSLYKYNCRYQYEDEEERNKVGSLGSFKNTSIEFSARFEPMTTSRKLHEATSREYALSLDIIRKEPS